MLSLYRISARADTLSGTARESRRYVRLESLTDTNRKPQGRYHTQLPGSRIASGSSSDDNEADAGQDASQNTTHGHGRHDRHPTLYVGCAGLSAGGRQKERGTEYRSANEAEDHDKATRGASDHYSQKPRDPASARRRLTRVQTVRRLEGVRFAHRNRESRTFRYA